MSTDNNRLILVIVLGALLAWAVSPTSRPVQHTEDVSIKATVCQQGSCPDDHNGSDIALGYLEWRLSHQLMLNTQRSPSTTSFSSGTSYRRGR